VQAWVRGPRPKHRSEVGTRIRAPEASIRALGSEVGKDLGLLGLEILARLTSPAS